MTDPKIEVVPAAAWAGHVAGRLADAVRARPSLRLCLPTGETPAPFYAALARLAGSDRVSFGAATVVLLDEYVGLAPGDRARCDAQLRRQLIDHLDPAPRFVPIDVDGADPAAAVAAIDAEAAGLDLAIVGLGLNGHIGMNEPGSTADSPTRRVALAEPTRRVAVERYGAGREPEAGITIGMDRLLEAHETWLLVTGERKAAVLAAALAGPETPDCPGSYLRRSPRLVVLADEPAAAALQALQAGSAPQAR